MITEMTVTRYKASCDRCGWRGVATSRREYAARSLFQHPCGRHYQAHDSTGGYRGILGGYNVSCVCGAQWVDRDGFTPFHCPRDTTNEAAGT